VWAIDLVLVTLWKSLYQQLSLMALMDQGRSEYGGCLILIEETCLDELALLFGGLLGDLFLG
jgi:hypothetical protein